MYQNLLDLGSPQETHQQGVATEPTCTWRICSWRTGTPAEAGSSGVRPLEWRADGLWVHRRGPRQEVAACANTDADRGRSSSVRVRSGGEPIACGCPRRIAAGASARVAVRQNVWRLCCRADRAPGAAPTAFALGFKCLRRARGPRPGQYQPLVVGRGPARGSP
jgi:hypothetical protein